jgi:hypothetical protein
MTRKKHKEYELGDSAWFCGVYSNGDKTKGKVVHKFKLDDYNEELYVLQINTHIEPLFYVREWGCLSDTEDGFLNFFSKH